VNNKLFVGNLSFTTAEGVLMETFAAYGTVSEAILMTDKMTGRSRGFAFVTMSTDEEAQAAIDGLNGKELDGRRINVNVARPKEDRPPGGGFRGGGGGGGGRREYGGGGGGGGGGGYGGGRREGGYGGGGRREGGYGGGGRREGGYGGGGGGGGRRDYGGRSEDRF
jgi:RNA recognition motif-containing protein